MEKIHSLASERQRMSYEETVTILDHARWSLVLRSVEKNKS